jgi:site-specific DNA-methyltransferase (adenine-specific)
MISPPDNAESHAKSWTSPHDLAKVFLGDTMEIMEGLPDESVDCIWTDPPYLLSNGGMTCVAGRMVTVDKGKWDRSQGLEKDHEFNRKWLGHCFRLLKPGGSIWASGTLHVYLSVGMAMKEVGFRILNDIVWEKPAPPPNLGRRCFTHATEMLLWASKGGTKARYTFHYEQMVAENGGKQMRNVWRDISPPGKDEKKLGRHPTQKPVKLVMRCLRATTNPGDVVFDPFAGSGTTGVAALALGRRFIGCEGEEGYARLAVRRLKQQMLASSTSEEAEHETPAEAQRPLELR